MITTSSSINITKTLRKGSITTYGTSNISLFIKTNGTQKRFDATTVINSSVDANGLITFSNVPLWEDGSYSLYITAENNNNLDVNGIDLVTLATGYIKKITNSNMLEL